MSQGFHCCPIKWKHISYWCEGFPFHKQWATNICYSFREVYWLSCDLTNMKISLGCLYVSLSLFTFIYLRPNSLWARVYEQDQPSKLSGLYVCVFNFYRKEKIRVRTWAEYITNVLALCVHLGFYIGRWDERMCLGLVCGEWLEP